MEEGNQDQTQAEVRMPRQILRRLQGPENLPETWSEKDYNDFYRLEIEFFNKINLRVKDLYTRANITGFRKYENLKAQLQMYQFPGDLPDNSELGVASRIAMLENRIREVLGDPAEKTMLILISKLNNYSVKYSDLWIKDNQQADGNYDVGEDEEDSESEYSEESESTEGKGRKHGRSVGDVPAPKKPPAKQAVPMSYNKATGQEGTTPYKRATGRDESILGKITRSLPSSSSSYKPVAQESSAFTAKQKYDKLRDTYYTSPDKSRSHNWAELHGTDEAKKLLNDIRKDTTLTDQERLQKQYELGQLFIKDIEKRSGVNSGTRVSVAVAPARKQATTAQSYLNDGSPDAIKELDPFSKTSIVDSDIVFNVLVGGLKLHLIEQLRKKYTLKEDFRAKLDKELKNFFQGCVVSSGIKSDYQTIKQIREDKVLALKYDEVILYIMQNPKFKEWLNSHATANTTQCCARCGVLMRE